jgi:glutamate synthase (NADPH/NADH) large chain
MDEMIGRVDRLNFRQAIDHWKAKGLDYSAILHMPALPEGAHGAGPGAGSWPRARLDQQLIVACADAIENEHPCRWSSRSGTSTGQRGTMLGYKLTKNTAGKGAARRHDPS